MKIFKILTGFLALFVLSSNASAASDGFSVNGHYPDSATAKRICQGYEPNSSKAASSLGYYSTVVGSGFGKCQYTVTAVTLLHAELKAGYSACSYPFGLVGVNCVATMRYPVAGETSVSLTPEEQQAKEDEAAAQLAKKRSQKVIELTQMLNAKLISGDFPVRYDTYWQAQQTCSIRDGGSIIAVNALVNREDRVYQCEYRSTQDECHYSFTYVASVNQDPSQGRCNSPNLSWFAGEPNDPAPLMEQKIINDATAYYTTFYDEYLALNQVTLLETYSNYTELENSCNTGRNESGFFDYSYVSTTSEDGSFNRTPYIDSYGLPETASYGICYMFETSSSRSNCAVEFVGSYPVYEVFDDGSPNRSCAKRVYYGEGAEQGLIAYNMSLLETPEALEKRLAAEKAAEVAAELVRREAAFTKALESRVDISDTYSDRSSAVLACSSSSLDNILFSRSTYTGSGSNYITCELNAANRIGSIVNVQENMECSKYYTGSSLDLRQRAYAGQFFDDVWCDKRLYFGEHAARDYAAYREAMTETDTQRIARLERERLLRVQEQLVQDRLERERLAAEKLVEDANALAAERTRIEGLPIVSNVGEYNSLDDAKSACSAASSGSELFSSSRFVLGNPLYGECFLQAANPDFRNCAAQFEGSYDSSNGDFQGCAKNFFPVDSHAVEFRNFTGEATEVRIKTAERTRLTRIASERQAIIDQEIADEAAKQKIIDDAAAAQKIIDDAATERNRIAALPRLVRPAVYNTVEAAVAACALDDTGLFDEVDGLIFSNPLYGRCYVRYNHNIASKYRNCAVHFPGSVQSGTGWCRKTFNALPATLREPEFVNLINSNGTPTLVLIRTAETAIVTRKTTEAAAAQKIIDDAAAAQKIKDDAAAAVAETARLKKIKDAADAAAETTERNRIAALPRLNRPSVYDTVGSAVAACALDDTGLFGEAGTFQFGFPYYGECTVLYNDDIATKYRNCSVHFPGSVRSSTHGSYGCVKRFSAVASKLQEPEFINLGNGSSTLQLISNAESAIVTRKAAEAAQRVTDDAAQLAREKAAQKVIDDAAAAAKKIRDDAAALAKKKADQKIIDDAAAAQKIIDDAAAAAETARRKKINDARLAELGVVNIPSIYDDGSAAYSACNNAYNSSSFFRDKRGGSSSDFYDSSRYAHDILGYEGGYLGGRYDSGSFLCNLVQVVSSPSDCSNQFLGSSEFTHYSGGRYGRHTATCSKRLYYGATARRNYIRNTESPPELIARLARERLIVEQKDQRDRDAREVAIDTSVQTNNDAEARRKAKEKADRLAQESSAATAARLLVEKAAKRKADKAKRIADAAKLADMRAQLERDAAAKRAVDAANKSAAASKLEADLAKKAQLKAELALVTTTVASTNKNTQVINDNTIATTNDTIAKNKSIVTLDKNTLVNAAGSIITKENSISIDKNTVSSDKNTDSLDKLTEAVNKNTEVVREGGGGGGGTVTATLDPKLFENFDFGFKTPLTESVSLLEGLLSWVSGDGFPEGVFPDIGLDDILDAFNTINPFAEADAIFDEDVPTAREYYAANKEMLKLLQGELVTVEDKSFLDEIKGWGTDQFDAIRALLPAEDYVPEGNLSKEQSKAIKEGASIDYIVGLGGYEGKYSPEGGFVKGGGGCPFQFFTIKPPTIGGVEGLAIKQDLSILCTTMTIVFNIGFAAAFLGIIIWGMRFIFS